MSQQAQRCSSGNDATLATEGFTIGRCACYGTAHAPPAPHFSNLPRDTHWVTATLEEYRQVYPWALFRLTALEQRIPVAGATLTAMLGTVGVLPMPVQIALLVGQPFSLLWLVRTTVNHVRSFEDAIRRF
jgi:hypothetical protein